MEHVYKNIIKFLKEYQESTYTNGYILGVSGGKDSTIVAKLLVDAVGKENVLGVLMPNGEQKDIEDSKRVCELLDIDYTIVNISDAYESMIDGIQSVYDSNLPNIHGGYTKNGRNLSISDKALTNIPPRIRMTILYAIAQSLGYLVCGTGNKSERMIGWFTKWGDGACDINPIAHLTCTEVIALGDYLELPYDLVHKTPADGLTGKSDEENIGLSYAVIDHLITHGYNSIELSTTDASKFDKLYRSSRHKFAPVTLE